MLLPKSKISQGDARQGQGNKPWHGRRIWFFRLKALESGWITSRQIEAVRVTLSRTMKRDGRSGFEFFQINL